METQTKTTQTKTTQTKAIQLEHAEDMNLIIKPDDAPQWRVAYEHVSNVKVAVGGWVSVGQIIAEVSPYRTDIGKTALLIFYGAAQNGSGDNTAYCPFMLLHESVETQLLTDLRTILRSGKKATVTSSTIMNGSRLAVL